MMDPTSHPIETDCPIFSRGTTTVEAIARAPSGRTAAIVVATCPHDMPDADAGRFGVASPPGRSPAAAPLRASGGRRKGEPGIETAARVVAGRGPFILPGHCPVAAIAEAGRRPTCAQGPAVSSGRSPESWLAKSAEKAPLSSAGRAEAGPHPHRGFSLVAHPHLLTSRL